MKNWNTDISKFTSKKAKRTWELAQLINYGLNGQKLNVNEIKSYWDELKKNLDPERARMIEYYVWGKTYSLKHKQNFWNLFPKKNK